MRQDGRSAPADLLASAAIGGDQSSDSSPAASQAPGRRRLSLWAYSRLSHLALGLFGPPVETRHFISAAIARVEVEQVVDTFIPFYLAAPLISFLISYVPVLTL